MTTLLIGCGFLGTRVGVLLAKRGERVFGTVRSAARAAEIASFGIESVVADVLNPQTLRDLPAAERVFYCVGFDRTCRRLHAVRLCGWAGERSRQSAVARPVALSMPARPGVFGQTEGEWVDETTPPVPHTESGKICLEAEEQLAGWAKRLTQSPRSTVLRFAGLYGPGRVVRRTLVEQGEPIPGDPAKLLNLIHIDDAAEGGRGCTFTSRRPTPLSGQLTIARSPGASITGWWRRSWLRRPPVHATRSRQPRTGPGRDEQASRAIIG